MGSRRGGSSFFENKGLPVPAPFREASREPFWEPFWRPRRLPRGSGSAPGAPGEPQERPRRPEMSPRRLQMSSRRPQMNPRRPERSPRRRKTSPRRPQGANLTLFSCFGLPFSRVSKTRETYEAIRVLQGPATVGSYRSAPSSNRPASPRSGRARAEALVRACCLDSRAALVTLALLLFVVLGRSVSCWSCCSRCSCLACNA